MEFIERSGEGKSQGSSQALFCRITKILEALKTHISLIKSQAKTVSFSVLLREKKNSQAKLWTQWQITTTQALNLHITLTDQHKSFLLPDPSINPADLLQKLNRESIFGTYFAAEGNPYLISFRHAITTANSYRFLVATFNEIFWQISQQFAKWTLKLKLVAGDEKCKSGKIYNCLKRMRYMK